MKHFIFYLSVFLIAYQIGCEPNTPIRRLPYVGSSEAPKSSSLWKRFREQPFWAQAAEGGVGSLILIAIGWKALLSPPPQPTLFAKGQTGPAPKDVVQPQNNTSFVSAFLYGLAEQRPERIQQIIQRTTKGWNVSLKLEYIPQTQNVRSQEVVFVSDALLAQVLHQANAASKLALWPHILTTALLLHLGKTQLADITDQQLEKKPPDKTALNELKEDGYTLISNFMPDLWALFLNGLGGLNSLPEKTFEDGTHGFALYGTDSREWFKYLRNLFKNKYIVLAHIDLKYDTGGQPIRFLTYPDGTKKGLLTQHYYTVISIKRRSSKNYWVRFHNPDQTREYGLCARYDHNELLAVEQQDCPTGNFELTLEDFLKYFDIIAL